MLSLSHLKSRKGLIVCSAGGHLTEALLLAKKLGIFDTSIFVTHENSQSTSLLQQVEYRFLPYVKSRDIVMSLKAYLKLRKICKTIEYDFILSTGAAISFSALLLHLETRKPYFYNELITRVIKPSFSGRILQFFPSVQLYSPHSHNFSSVWKKSPSLLDVFSKQPKDGERKENLNIFVSLGTMSPYRFDRLIDEVLSVLQPIDTVTWQLGCTDRMDTPGRTFGIISNEDFLANALAADVVVCHAGVGSLLDLITNGIRPIVVPRSSALGEHIDNHQLELADYFKNLDLIFVPDGVIQRSDLIDSSRYRIS
jgi:UDP-N-acetylglucosamine transferase subunit ALG13